VNEQPRVLVVEDEPSFVDALTSGLRREGFVVEVAVDGVEALRRFEQHQPDLVLLDLMLPKLSGLDVCRELRSRSPVPIIMLTARDAELDTVVGLEMGADDYVTKPYRLRELVARIRAALRRAAARAEAGGGGGQGGAPVLEVGDVSLDPERHEVRVRGAEVALARKEFELLELLLRNAGRVLTRDALMYHVWGSDYVGETRTIDTHVKRLRAKIEDDPGRPARITTIRGVGYRYEVPRTAEG
jgi:two-component system response regulator RegX3